MRPPQKQGYGGVGERLREAATAKGDLPEIPTPQGTLFPRLSLGSRLTGMGVLAAPSRLGCPAGHASSAVLNRER